MSDLEFKKLAKELKDKQGNFICTFTDRSHFAGYSNNVGICDRIRQRSKRRW